MNSNDIVLSIVFFSQVGIGIIGNFMLISFFTFMFLSGHKLRPVDTILIQLALANSLALLCKGIPQTMVAMGRKNFLDIIGCRITLYLQRVARGLSVTLTCLLSGFQAITISPGNSSSANLKVRAPKYIIPSSLLSWTFHLLLNVFIPMGMVDPKHMKNITEIQHYGYCAHLVPSGFRASLYAFVHSFPDAVFVGFMGLSSGYMVFLLYRHHKRVEPIHITCLSARASPETRATKIILIIVSTFVSSYSVDCFFTAYMSFVRTSPGLMHTSAFLVSCFPVISSYTLIFSDSQILKFCCVLWRRKTSHSDTINTVKSSATF